MHESSSTIHPAPLNKSRGQGMQNMRDPAINRGSATELRLRKELGMQGLLPASQAPLQAEIDRAHAAISRSCSPLDKYQAVMGLRESSWDIFYGLLSQNIKEFLPIIYTPTVGEACQKWSSLLQRPLGLYLSLNDTGAVMERLAAWPERDVKVVVLTDGQRILGLGDLGANGMGIPVGKVTVHTAAAGISPRHLLPIALDVGCNTQGVQEDPFYIGLRQKRAVGQAYDELVDELMMALRSRYGPLTLIHWEDFGVQNAFMLLAKYREQGFATFNDDIQATAAVTLGALLGAQRQAGVPKLQDQTFLFFGAGQANIGAAQLLTLALTQRGLSPEEARSRIWLIDSQGIIYEGRKERKGNLSPQKAAFARSASDAHLAQQAQTDLSKAVELVGPDALIGAAAQGGAFSERVVRTLTKAVRRKHGRDARPAVFALSNPVEEAECTAQQAYDWSGGRAVFASGTAFPGVSRRDGSQFTPGQCNNCLIFPGVALGCIGVQARQISDAMMLAASNALSGCVTAEELKDESVLPRIERLREVALRVGAAVAHEAIQGGGAPIEGQLREGLRGVTSKAARLHIIGDYLQRLQYNPFRNASAVT
ncbi:hypothetical protein CVIRNUC_000608 [Coccomyxa viridis]|uniref:Malic enzyme n=1 Tax=Coccomyxa viridis TaxID=1274662 RepID=A0AAV1HRX0_9CHLO|nr:hypothetical protein CVIRNUC_000608 [Coccomyxa viridis]